jgi:hypothetical protein
MNKEKIIKTKQKIKKNTWLHTFLKLLNLDLGQMCIPLLFSVNGEYTSDTIQIYLLNENN